MTRTTPEWIGANDNSPIPPRVKLRVFTKAKERCQHCERRICGKLTAEYDHITALINGGGNRESNIQLLCVECHGQKTKADVAEKSTIYRKRMKHLGLRPKGRPMPGSKASGFKKLMNGQVVPR